MSDVPEFMFMVVRYRSGIHRAQKARLMHNYPRPRFSSGGLYESPLRHTGPGFQMARVLSYRGNHADGIGACFVSESAARAQAHWLNEKALARALALLPVIARLSLRVQQERTGSVPEDVRRRSSAREPSARPTR